MSDICFMGACLIALAPINVATLDGPSMDIAYDYTGKQHNIAHFYEKEGEAVSIDAVALFSNGLAVRLGGNSAIDTAKYDVKPSYRVGATKAWELNDRLSLTTGFDYQFTGESRDSACLDQFDREYYCATLTPFSEKGSSNAKDPYSVSLRVSYQF